MTVHNSLLLSFFDFAMNCTVQQASDQENLNVEITGIGLRTHHMYITEKIKVEKAAHWYEKCIWYEVIKRQYSGSYRRINGNGHDEADKNQESFSMRSKMQLNPSSSQSSRLDS